MAELKVHRRERVANRVPRSPRLKSRGRIEGATYCLFYGVIAPRLHGSKAVAELKEILHPTGLDAVRVSTAQKPWPN